MSVRRTLSTGSGYNVGEPLWLQIEQGGGIGRTLVDDVQIAVPLHGKRGYPDFAIFAQYWQENNCGLCGGADVTGDGNVNIDDLTVFAAIWLDDAF